MAVDPPTKPPISPSLSPEVKPAGPHEGVPAAPVSTIPAVRIQDAYRPTLPRSVIQAMQRFISRQDRGGNIVDLIKQNLPKGDSPKGASTPEAKTTYSVKEGKLVAVNPGKIQKEVKEGGEKGEGRELSSFEKIFVARFTKGLSLGEEQPSGRLVFGKKSQTEWSTFFEKMSPFAFEKTATLEGIKEMIFRGLFGQSVVSDLLMTSGKMDKFARLLMTSEGMTTTLANLTPGEAIAPGLVTTGSEVTYTALSHKPVKPEPADLAARGVAQAREQMNSFLNISSQAQNLALRDLNLQEKYGPERTRDQGEIVGTGEPLRKKGGLLSALFGRKKKKGFGLGDDEESGVPFFVPWFLGPAKRRDRTMPGKPRWFIILTYLTAIAAFLLAITFALKFLL
ncbi:MAG: hypothetical protein HYS22_03755 [Deltaproteobacteria bacterium]|nr:hypothetical protein [Deltaproteobacteria bacterium]